jgi:hypothetical protein
MDETPQPYEIADPDDGYHPAQLRPVKGGRYVKVFHGPPGTDVGDLHCDLEPYMEGDRPAIINHSGWMPSDDQLAQLAAGGHVRLSVFMHPIPPLAVWVEPPVDDQGRPLVWVPQLQAFLAPEHAGEHMASEEARKRAEADVRRDFRPE